MAAIKYYEEEFRDEESESNLQQELALWGDPLESDGGGLEGTCVFVESLLLNADVLEEGNAGGPANLGRVKVRRVVFREA
jgi:hypothetical protein